MTSVVVHYHPQHPDYKKDLLNNLLEYGALWIDESIGPSTCYVVIRPPMDVLFDTRWSILGHCPDFLLLEFIEEKDAAMFLLKFS